MVDRDSTDNPTIRRASTGTPAEIRSAFDAEQAIRRLVESGAIDAAATLSLRVYGPELFGFLARMAPDRASARDSYSQVSERIWRGLAGFRWQSSLRTWAYAITHNSLATFRGKKRGCEIPHAQISTGFPAKSEPSATPLHERTTLRDALTVLRASLSTEDRELLVLRVDRNMAWRDLAIAFLDDCATPERIERESTRLRQRFSFIKRNLVTLAHKQGLHSLKDRDAVIESKVGRRR
jgi:RNA polymerase sigma-70 factor, ECF subfamily